jgi:MoCo/4Fe-4S cofactor protein with predicted Tat translocation signal
LLGLPPLIAMKTRPLPAQIELRRGGPRFWKSLEEWSQSPEFLPYLHREFPEYASEWDAGISRRRFLQLMGASFALAGLTACSRQPQEKIVPYVRRPEEIIPGRPVYYATTFPHRGYGKGVIVRTEMGRPIHIEGNPDHPASLGATDSFMQASILGLYDPDRSQAIRQGKHIQTWDAFAPFAVSRAQEHEKDQGAGLFLLSGKITSPSLLDQFERLHQRFPKLTWCEYETADPVRARSVSGKKTEPHNDLGGADIILSLDADFLADGPANLIHIKAFSKRRRDPASDFNRLYVVESVPTITGAKADQRWSRKPSDIILFAEEIADAVLNRKPATDPEIQKLVAELQSKPGRSAIIAGDYQPEIIHALAFQMNQALGNIGATVRYEELADSNLPRVSLAGFVEGLNNGVGTTLLIAGPNPVYDLPIEIGFAEALAKVPHSTHLGLYDDETGSLCEWHVPESHYLEAWGDVLAIDGTPSLIQPLIEPLYPGSASLPELISLFIDVAPLKGYEIVHRYWQGKQGDASQSWNLCLNKGVVTTPTPGAVTDGVPVAKLLPPIAVAGVNGSSYEILFRPDSSADDGRYANNGWLQELPRPLTKLTWDNVATISPKSGVALGVKTGDMVELKTDSGSVSAPIWIQPGHADGCVSVTLGYGRAKAGEVANGVGFNAGVLRTSALTWSLPDVRIEKLNRTHDLASTQHHFSMEGRGLIQIETLDDYKIDPRKAQEAQPDPPPQENLYPPHEYKNHAWAMSIDLNTCVGCNACIVACQSENNIPVVGKDQVLKGREMHWLRVDRYFEGPPEEPAMHFQPVACMQCEDAPCEVVCPVGATVHSSEGLNDMVYNRCVGTRYCSNNCPYKVRRFNFLEYSDTTHPTIALQKNRDVTIRSRGVMEKCTYCVQRIESARIDAQKEMRPIRDGEIITACQSACPAEAIVFGDINDPNSRVSRLKKLPRNYGLLADLNTHPRTTYLAKITNPPTT